MSDWKLVVKITLGCVTLLFLAIWGLTKMGDQTGGGLKADVAELLNGARFVKENGETKVTVVTFSDMQCPACKAADAKNKELFTMPGVKVVMRHFPLPTNVHKFSQVSARAAEAANLMGKGWEMVQILFDKQDEWSAVSDPKIKFLEYAKSLGLDENVFLEKLESKEVYDNVAMDAALAARLQLSGTPTIYVNGEQVGAPFVLDKVKQLLESK